MTSRRNFIKIAAASGLACAAPQLLASNRLNIGIGTYSYHGLSVEDMIVQLNALRIREIEMSRGEFMLMNHPSPELFSATREKLDRAGIRCVSYYSATMNDGQDIERAIHFAKLLGCANITGDAPAPVLKQIDERLTKAGLTFGLHNHFFPKIRFAYESPDEVWNAISGLSKTMGATADTGQFAICGYDPVDAIRKLAPRLRLVHLKDVKAKDDEENVLLGTGIARIPAVMDELHRQNFAGLVAIEYEQENDVEDMVKQVAFARKLA
ncbi:sugar phosphate isomerase/epimerase [Silvibacterium bohemicum]|uniref:Sugar phosphate isomerase/epimerase n=1 Tax=Silvibacterium bohemicum TaxID=1577686 RepID=A0A841K031_9BACT|nr:sugar phosphate isomerase/epimerase [Silvibacterium bohemicum]MBB6143594.1 sugar phosphate isomerase/epimerase [Silvibacterium bohemicum]